MWKSLDRLKLSDLALKSNIVIDLNDETMEITKRKLGMSTEWFITQEDAPSLFRKVRRDTGVIQEGFVDEIRPHFYRVIYKDCDHYTGFIT